MDEWEWVRDKCGGDVKVAGLGFGGIDCSFCFCSLVGDFETEVRTGAKMTLQEDEPNYGLVHGGHVPVRRHKLDIRMPQLILIAAVLLLAGCETRTLDSRGFHALTQRRGKGHLYYTGTEERFHYFATSYFLEPTRHFRLPVSDYSITNLFARTSDRSRWVPWMVDLSPSPGAEGFRGEQIHVIQE